MKKYKLIKKLPFEGSPKIGYISEPHRASVNGAHYWNHNFFNPEDYPEYWEEIVELSVPIGTKFTVDGSSTIYTLSEVRENMVIVTWPYGPIGYSIEDVNRFLGNGKWEVYKKDYEILSFSAVGLDWSGVAKKQKGGKYYTPHSVLGWTEDSMLHTGNCVDNGKVLIHSVKRLSDGEVFTLGDKIGKGLNLIESFELGTDSTQKHMMFFNKCYSINLLEKKTLLFTTEDGVEIFSGDRVWVISKEYKNSPICNYLIDNKGVYYLPEANWYFSSKEAAEEHILFNSKVLCIEDILARTIEELKELVKTRL